MPLEIWICVNWRVCGFDYIPVHWFSHAISHSPFIGTAIWMHHGEGDSTEFVLLRSALWLWKGRHLYVWCLLYNCSLDPEWKAKCSISPCHPWSSNLEPWKSKHYRWNLRDLLLNQTTPVIRFCFQGKTKLCARISVCACGTTHLEKRVERRCCPPLLD